MRFLAIDPGPTESAWIVLNESDIVDFGKAPNRQILDVIIGQTSCKRMAVEGIASYGMAVGKEVFETCMMIGRMLEKWYAKTGFEGKLVYRLEVKMALCHDSRAKDSNIRQAIIDRFPATGGGKCPQVGIEKKRGPLYGVSKDIWSALGVALTAQAKL